MSKERIFVRREIMQRTDFRFKTVSRKDRKHSWAQHADSDSYLYRILGRWEHLARMNGGFVYETPKQTAKKVAHYRQDDAPCVRVIQLVKQFCRSKGFISLDADGTNQWGQPVRGFYLAPHWTCCDDTFGPFVLLPAYNVEVLQNRFSADAMKLWSDCTDHSQSIRDGFAMDSHTIRDGFAHDSPKSGFEFAASVPQILEKPETSQKSGCALVAGNVLNGVNDKSGGSGLNAESPCFSKSKAKVSSKDETKSPARTEHQEHPQVRLIVKEVNRINDAAQTTSWDRREMSRILLDNADYTDDEVTKGVQLFMYSLNENLLGKAGERLAGKLEAILDNGREHLGDEAAQAEYVSKLEAGAADRRKQEDEERREQRETAARVAENPDLLFGG